MKEVSCRLHLNNPCGCLRWLCCLSAWVGWFFLYCLRWYTAFNDKYKLMSQALRLIGPIGYVLFGIFVAGATILPLLDNFAEPVIDGDLGMGYYIKIA